MQYDTLINRRQYNKLEILLCCMLVIPFASHWILLDSLERLAYLNLLGVPFYLPNLCYFVYIYNYNRLISNSHDYVKKRTKNNIILLTLLLLINGVISSCFSDSNAFVPLVFNNLSLVWASVVFFFFPMNMTMIDNTKYVIIPTAIIISLEIILFGLGVLTYELDLGTNEYEGIIRISTTVGAATGTAVALIMMGFVILDCYILNNKMKISLLLLITVAIFFTVSRGSIALWSLYLIFFLYRYYFRHRKFGKNIKYLSLVAITLFLLFSWGVFDPVINRTMSLIEEGQIDAGRDELIDKAMKLYYKTGGIGVGNGIIQVDKSLLQTIDDSRHIRVHSYYISTLVEMGIIGLAITILYLLFLVSKFDYKRIISYGSIMILLLTFNSEPIFSQAEFMSPAVFLFMISLKRQSI